MEENNQSQNLPVLCRKSCGFYGSPSFDGFCSKCHRDMQAQVEQAQQNSLMPSGLDTKIVADMIQKSPELHSSRFTRIPSPDSVPDVPESISRSSPLSHHSPATRHPLPYAQLINSVDKADVKTDSLDSDISKLDVEAKSDNIISSKDTDAAADAEVNAINTSSNKLLAVPDSSGILDGAVGRVGGSNQILVPGKMGNTTENVSEAAEGVSASAGTTQNSKPGSPASTTSSTSGAQKKRPRCDICNKRVGLTGFSCRCGGLYCGTHRYSDTHNCAFDYRESGQAEIRRANPQVLCSKLNKI